MQRPLNRPSLVKKSFLNSEIFPCSESIYIMYTRNVYLKIKRGDTKDQSFYVTVKRPGVHKAMP